MLGKPPGAAAWWTGARRSARARVWRRRGEVSEVLPSDGADGGNRDNRFSGDPDDFATAFARIKVVGVGGAGGNAINRMVEAGVDGIEFVAVNTDSQALLTSAAPI